MVAEIVVVVAAFERRLLLKWQKVGIAMAKAEGWYKGRGSTARWRSPEVFERQCVGMLPAEIAKQLWISQSLVFLALRAA